MSTKFLKHLLIVEWLIRKSVFLVALQDRVWNLFFDFETPLIKRVIDDLLVFFIELFRFSLMELGLAIFYNFL